MSLPARLACQWTQEYEDEPMGDTWITHLPDLLDRDGQIPRLRGGSRIAKHLTAIVSAVTVSPSTSPQATGLRCRR